MKVNIESIKLKNLPEMFGGTGNYIDISVNDEVTSICTDSREASEGSLFVAIRGENTDGHNYIRTAVENGAIAVICDHIPQDAPAGCYYLITGDTEKALMKGASFYRNRLTSLRSCAITGSVGKTTAKEAVWCALSAAENIYKTDGNFNSVIGMPIALMAMPSDTEIAVFEMGMSGRGEIRSMSESLKPDVAVITNVGHSHLEFLKTRENILKAKLEITEGLSDNGTLIINGDDIMLRTVDFSAYSFRTVRVSIHDDSAEYFAYNIRFRDGYMQFDLISPKQKLADIKMPGTGNHLVLSALFALAAADAFGADIALCAKGLENFKNASMRQNITKIGPYTVIEDCYNAAPESMRSAIDTLASLSSEKKECKSYAVLGEMRELGADSARLHAEVGRYVAEKKVDCLIGVGTRGEDIVLGAQYAGMRRVDTYLYKNPEDYDRIARLLSELMNPGDVVLVKASRGLKAERIVEALRNITDN